jgi:hypothetical protein
MDALFWPLKTNDGLVISGIKKEIVVDPNAKLASRRRLGAIGHSIEIFADYALSVIEGVYRRQWRPGVLARPGVAEQGEPSQLTALAEAKYNNFQFKLEFILSLIDIWSTVIRLAII